MGRRLRRAAAAALLLVALAAGWPWVGAHLRAAGLLLQLVGGEDSSGITSASLSPVHVSELALELPSGTVRARRYEPRDDPGGPAVVLLAGVHPQGIDEKRLRSLARALASAGLRVLTPQFEELAHYRVEEVSIARIGQAAAAQARHCGRSRAGVVGISFAGGLALLAAGRAGGQRIGWLLALGAHHDLHRVARYYGGAQVRGPDGTPSLVTPHPYGARVIVHAHAERIFRKNQVGPARRALSLYMSERYSAARKAAADVQGPGQALLQALVQPASTADVGALLLPHVERVRTELAPVSPRGQLRSLAIPIYLLHGTGDPIVPSIETQWLASELPAASLRRTLITPVLRHAEFPRTPTKAEYWQLIHFMAGILREADSGH